MALFTQLWLGVFLINRAHRLPTHSLNLCTYFFSPHRLFNFLKLSVSSWVHFPLCRELRFKSLSLQTNSVQDIYFTNLPYCKCLTSVWQNHKPFSIQFSVILNTAKENTAPNTSEPLEMISLPLWLGPQSCSVIHVCFPSRAFLSSPKW